MPSRNSSPSGCSLLFTEGRYFVLFAVVFATYWTLRGNGARKRLLLAASYVFYGAWDWRFLGLLWLTTLVDYVAGLLLDGGLPHRRRLVLGCALAANIGILGIFKYYDFFVTSGAAVAGLFGAQGAPPLLGLILPAGISFYTFQSMSYTIDVYRGMRAERNLVDYALYVAFFPQLVAGPIVRGGDLLPQFDAPRRWAEVDVRAALVVFLIGYVKKAVLADNVAPLVDAYFAAPQQYTAASAWTASLAYGLQLYCDFSGYSDMAVGSAGLLGYRLPQNFRQPFLSTSPLDWWRRWHMSFSTWLRDYVYAPLRGEGRGSAFRTNLNILLTLLVSGLWHGAGWSYVLFGGLHGVAIVNERLWRRTILYERIPPRIRAVLGFLYNHALMTLLRVLFRAPDLATAGVVYAACFTGTSAGGASLPAYGAVAWAGMVGAQAVAASGGFERAWRSLPPWAFAMTLGLAWAAALVLCSVEYRPFVYFAF